MKKMKCVVSLTALSFVLFCIPLSGFAGTQQPLSPMDHSISDNTKSLNSKKLSEIEALILTIKSGVNDLDNGKAVHAVKVFTQVSESLVFTELPAFARAKLYYYLGQAEYKTGQYLSAYDHLLKAAETVPEVKDSYYWFLMGDIARRLDKTDVELEAVINVSKSYPVDLKYYDLSYVAQLSRRAKAMDDKGIGRFKLLHSLWSAHYMPNEGGTHTEFLWFDLFEIYADKGDEAKAREILPSLVSLDSLISLHSDKRFFVYAKPNITDQDIQSVIEAGLAEAKKNLSANPRKLEFVTGYANMLVRVNRLPQAIEVIDKTLAQLDSEAKKHSLFDDFSDQYNWLLNVKSSALSRLGRVSEAEIFLKKARSFAISQNGDQVSQKINLAGFLDEHSRSQEALDEIKDLNATQSSPYGIMAAENVKVCAYAHLGDKAKLAKSLDYMRKHADDGFGPYRDALMCAGDVDSLAEIIIARLENRETRLATLVELQTYLDVQNPTINQQRYIGFRKTLMARHDVREALAKHGFINSYKIFAPRT